MTIRLLIQVVVPAGEPRGGGRSTRVGRASVLRVSPTSRPLGPNAVARGDGLWPAATAAVASGSLAAAALPPFNCAWLVWGAFVPVLVAVAARPGFARAFFLGSLTGLVLFIAVGYGQAAFYPGFCVLSSASLATLLGLIFAFHAALQRRHLPDALRVFILPSLWVAAEWGSARLRIPWSLALAVTDDLRTIQSAALLGIYGVSFLVVLANSTAFVLYEALCRRAAEGRSANATLRGCIAALALFGMNLAYGTWCLSTAPQASATLHVAAIQPVIRREEYVYQGLNATYRHRIKTIVEELSAAAAEQHPDLLVWPEGGNGQFNFRIPALRAAVTRLARLSRSALLLSTDDLDEAGRLRNAVFSVAPDGHVLGRYSKTWLMPVGEGEYTAGTALQPLVTPHGPMGAMVCFESCFTDLARALTQRGAGLLVVSTGDAAFRNSSVALLHSRFAVFRAVENRRSLIQAANIGPSLVITPYGEVTAQTAFLTRTVLRGEAGIYHGVSLYTRLGDWPVLASACAILIAAWLARQTANSPHRFVPGVIRRRPGPVMLVEHAAAITAAGSAAVLLAFASLICSNQSSAGLWSWWAAVQTFAAPPPVEMPADGAREFRQRHANTCGVAALAYLLSYLGFDLHESDLLPEVTVGPDGTSMAELARAARSRGSSAWGEWQTFETLQRQPKPVIAHIRDDHYVVVLAFAPDGSVDVFDPAIGYQRIGADDFRRVWRGYVLIVRLPELAT
jgi:apolipoprotein N-acyltransferase